MSPTRFYSSVQRLLSVMPLTGAGCGSVAGLWRPAQCQRSGTGSRPGQLKPALSTAANKPEKSADSGMSTFRQVLYLRFCELVCKLARKQGPQRPINQGQGLSAAQTRRWYCFRLFWHRPRACRVLRGRRRQYHADNQRPGREDPVVLEIPVAHQTCCRGRPPTQRPAGL